MFGILDLMKKFDKLKNKKFRHAYLAEHIRVGIATQIRILRSKAKMTQLQLAETVGTKQGVISRLEDPDSGYANLNTLLKIAEALDVSLMVKFVSFGKFMEESRDISPQGLTVNNYNEEYKIIQAQEDLLIRNTSGMSFFWKYQEQINHIDRSQVYSPRQIKSYLSTQINLCVIASEPKIEQPGDYSNIFQRKDVNAVKDSIIYTN